MAATYAGTPNDTGNVFIDVLADRKWDKSQAITYFFDDAASSSPWTANEKAAYRAALQTWADVADIFFEEVDTKAAANFVEQKYIRDPGIYADHENPDPSGVAIGRFNSEAPGWSDLGLRPGGLGFQTLVHEIGHGLGLNHPHPDQTNAEVGFPGVVTTVNQQGALEINYGVNNLNQTIYTIMSYVHGYASNFGDPASPNFGDAATPMPIDIAAIQWLYGESTTNATQGASYYLLPDTNAPGTGWVGIYDIDGIDQIKFDGSAKAVIDLRPLPISADPTLFDTSFSYLNYAEGINGGFTISPNSIIENASGGSGDDRIRGNDIGNELVGAEGKDELYGEGGNDTIRGGAGSDYINGGAGADRIYGDFGLSTDPYQDLLGSGDGVVTYRPTGPQSRYNAINLNGLFSLSENQNIDRSTTLPHITINATESFSNFPTYIPIDLGGVSGLPTITVDAVHWFKVDLPASHNFRGDAISSQFIADMDGKEFEIQAFYGSGEQQYFDPFTLNFFPDVLQGYDGEGSLFVGGGDTVYIAVIIPRPLPFDDQSEADHSYILNISIEAFGAGSVEDGEGDEIFGGAGDDTIFGGGGPDTLDGGAGNDTYYADTYLDQIVEGQDGGYDTIYSSTSFIMPANVEAMVLFGSEAADALGNDSDNFISGDNSSNRMAGGAGNDTMVGGGGDDAIDGGIGADAMIGGDGVDTYYVDDIGDDVVETEADVYDTVWTSLGNYTLPANVEIYIAINGAGSINGNGNDNVTLMLGNEGDNVLNGFGGDDMILGLGGNDTIDGGSSDILDIISGGAGADLLTGGAGHDYFNYELISHGGDTITDFRTNAGAEDDILDFRPMFTTFTNTAGITTVAQAVASGHLTYSQSGANTQVFADADGGGNNNVLMATLLNTTAASVQTYTLI